MERAILHAILRGTGETAFTEHRISLLDQAIYRRMADEAVVGVVRRHAVLRRYYTAPIRNPIRWTSVLATLLALAAFIGAIWLFPFITLNDTKKLPILTGFVGFVAVLAAALGWGVSGWVAHRTGRAKQTLDIVSARFAQPAFSKAFSDFNEGFIGKTINSHLVTQYATSKCDDERDALQGLRYLVNYFEFIAVGVLAGELDQRIVRKAFRGNIIYVYDKCARYIAEVQRDNPATLEHFTTLRLHYQEP